MSNTKISSKLAHTLININSIGDNRGQLSIIEGLRTIPFEIRRVYYLHDLAHGAERGGHAHRNLQQLIVPIVGSFDVYLDDGISKCIVNLNSPNEGLLIGNYIWREMKNFSPESVCLVLASEYYSEDDYFRKYEEFLAAIKNR
jgi:hypothetical protein